MKHVVTILRTGYSTITLEVEAESQDEATKKALEKAPNMEFTEHDADYSVDLTGSWSF